MTKSIEFHSSSLPVQHIFNWFLNGQLKLDPSFQRNAVWKLRQRIELLGSIFQGYPIPSIFLYRHIEEKTGKTLFEVIDGKQRIESLLQYAGYLRGRFGGHFAAPLLMPNEEKPREVNWRQLNRMKQQGLLEQYQVQIIEVTGDLTDIMKIFVLINSTGNALTPQEIRNARFYRSEFLKAAKRMASRYEKYLQSTGVMGPQQIRRMKHIEFMSELIYSANLGGVGNKKRVLDAAMDTKSLEGARLHKAVRHATSSLNRLRKMFPDLNRSVRFRKLSDFYSLAVLVQTFEANGLVLDDKNRNTLAWELLVAFASGVDMLSQSSKRLELKTLSPREEIQKQYLGAVREGSDSESNRRTRHQILRNLLEPIFEIKDQQRLFSAEQRRILWNTADERVCTECGCKLDWNNFHADHIQPYSSGGQTKLDNAAILCAKHNVAKGKKFRKTA
jgi:5-methylcytosine-specific restriction endonuclease McrA